jgi:hypothetical protein
MRTIPRKFRPVLIAIAFATLAWGAYFAFDVFDIGEQAVGECCAPEA